MASKYQSWTPSGLMAVKATTSPPSRRGVDVSNGVFVSGMYTKDDPVTWEIHVLVRSQERWLRAREDRSPRFWRTWKSEGRVRVKTSGKVGSRPVRTKAARVSRNFRREP